MNVAQNIHIVPLRATATDTATFVTPHINMKLYEKVEFLVIMGAATTADFTLTVTQDAATAGTTSTTAIAARYRRTDHAGTDTMGDVTTLASTGLAIANGTEDNHTLIVDVESQDLTTADKPYVGLTFTAASGASLVNTVVALCWPKYPKETNASALT